MVTSRFYMDGWPDFKFNQNQSIENIFVKCCMSQTNYRGIQWHWWLNMQSGMPCDRSRHQSASNAAPVVVSAWLLLSIPIIVGCIRQP